ncbi:spore germination protein PC [Salirhabdus euzebyi]|uniref:Spore germination protein PC n=1 Tax=Salirhabdus euzebyi TaxID=394506 RepID=A0A841Q3M2_9BACI|nr:spore germination protein GerPC [Salirhabdus euzebyi]MBB6452999.1 spore germination protein PC [Salirhabdus euzebyi]
MYYYNWHDYFSSLQNEIKNQQKKMSRLEEQVKVLESKVLTLQETPKTNVEKIEYHFDQLKIETLEGTLNIGLSPDGLSATDELSIPNPIPKQQQATPNQSPIVQELVQYLHPFFQQELPSKINEFAQESEKSFPPGFENMIIQDIYKQIPERIQHYTRLHSENNNGMLNNETKQKIVEDVKNEILHSVRNYIQGEEGGE